jgi:glycerol-3-phosphate dehydrogenase (NAD(P)+)
MNVNKVAVIGAGAWGTAVANLLAANCRQVHLWVSQKAHLDAILDERCNTKYLPGVQLAPNVTPSTEAQTVLEGARLVIWGVPVQYLRERACAFAPYLKEGSVCVNLGKGIEEGTWARPSEILGQECKSARAVGSIAGPNIAWEIASGMYAEATLALSDYRLLQGIKSSFSSDNFRVHTSADLIGLELSAALKNVIAIAAGLCDGLQPGVNTKSVVIAAGLAEMRRVGAALGANPASFLAESALGDLLASCFSERGRNRLVGENLGRGRSLAEATVLLNGRVAEGIATCRAVYQLQERLDLDLPVISNIYLLLTEQLAVAECVRNIVTRSTRRGGGSVSQDHGTFATRDLVAET